MAQRAALVLSEISATDEIVRQICFLGAFGGSEAADGRSVGKAAGIMYGFKDVLTLSELVCCGVALCFVAEKSSTSRCFLSVLAIRSPFANLEACLGVLAEYAGECAAEAARSFRVFSAWALSFVYIGVFGAIQLEMHWRKASANLRRKSVHVGMFLYYSLFPWKVVHVQTAGLLGGFLLLPRVAKTCSRAGIEVREESVFRAFLSEKDRRGVVSHVLLLSVCLSLLELLSENRGRFLFTISSVCIIDSVASFFPRDKNSNKSVRGSMAGAVCASVVLYCLGVEYPAVFYFLLGAAECTTEINDNITLPIIAYFLTSGAI